MPGVLAVGGPKWKGSSKGDDAADVDPDLRRLIDELEAWTRQRPSSLEGFPMIVVVDDSTFAAADLRNWLWVTFTRSDPANDVHGIGVFVHRKHWGCRGPVVIDARLKPYMAPPLVEDPAVEKRVDALFARGGPLEKYG
jgi:4-hydroxy-3-polyprenylbenzoate decarboxylase